MAWGSSLMSAAAGEPPGEDYLDMTPHFAGPDPLMAFGRFLGPKPGRGRF